MGSSTETTYYAEDLCSVPIAVMANALRHEDLPAFVAYPLAIYFRFRGLIGWRLPPSGGTACWGTELAVEKNEIPVKASSKFSPYIEQLHDLQFEAVEYHLPKVIGAKQQARALFVSHDGRTLANLEWVNQSYGTNTLQESTGVEFNSFTDSEFEYCTMLGFGLKSPVVNAIQMEFVDIEVTSNSCGVQRALNKHLERIAGQQISIYRPQEFAFEYKSRGQRRLQWLLDSGMIRPLSANQVEYVKKLSVH